MKIIKKYVESMKNGMNMEVSDSDQWYATKEGRNTCQALGDGARLNKQVVGDALTNQNSIRGRLRACLSTHNACRTSLRVCRRVMIKG